MSLGLLARQPLTWDSEAAAYILQVEAADGQSLEPLVARAINMFVIDCKVRGIWGAIKSSCLLCGARTLTGATIPLKGSAPTLTSFIGHYNRETGLRRTSGTFAINRNNNSDPQNSKHLAVFPTSIDCRNDGTGLKGLLANNTGSGDSFIYNDSTGGRIFLRANSSSNAFGSDLVNSNNLIGISVRSSSNTQIIYNNRILIRNNNTTSPNDSEIFLYGGSGLTSSTSRIAYYSVGENIDLRLLEQCLTQYMLNMKLAILSTYSSNNEASNWLSRVSSNAGSVSDLTRLAIHWFCNQIDDNNLRDRFYRLNLFCGNNLNSALVPLYRGQSLNGTQFGNTIDTNNNFTNVNYNPSQGLRNSGSSWLDTGLPQNYANDRFFALTAYFSPGSYGALLGSRPSTANFNSYARIGGGGGVNLLTGVVYTDDGVISQTAGNAYSPQTLYLVNWSPTLTESGYQPSPVYMNGEYVLYGSAGGRNTTDTTTFAIFATKVGASGFATPQACTISSYSFGVYVSQAQVTLLNNIFTIFNAMIGR